MSLLDDMDTLIGEWEMRGTLQIHGSPQVIAEVSRQELAELRQTVRRLKRERFGQGEAVRLGAAMGVVLGTEKARLVIEEAHKEGRIFAFDAQMMQIGVDTTPFTPPTSPLWGFDRMMRTAFGRGLRLS